VNRAERELYQSWIDRAEIDPDEADKVAGALARAIRNRPRYEAVARALSVPWTLLAALHEREASGNMDKHPANGDSLRARTTSHPAGLPRHVAPPFTYENVASEELAELERPADGVWTLLEMCHAAEHFNGKAYFRKGHPTPYVVASTTLERLGKIRRDHGPIELVDDKQVGCLALWIAMRDAGIKVP
jgi:lysozyme family protein